MTTPRLGRHAVALLAAGIMFLPACSEEPPAPGSAAGNGHAHDHDHDHDHDHGDHAGHGGDAAAGRVDAYTTRGTIRQLPDPANPAAALMIRHEAIPDFRNASGQVVGMDAMTMPFPLADGVSLDGLAVGDAVELDFSVRWGDRPAFHITRLTPQE